MKIEILPVVAFLLVGLFALGPSAMAQDYNLECAVTESTPSGDVNTKVKIFPESGTQIVQLWADGFRIEFSNYGASFWINLKREDESVSGFGAHSLNGSIINGSFQQPKVRFRCFNLDGLESSSA